MDMIEFGTALREARIAQGLTQAQVAASARIGRATLSRLESGTIGEIGLRKVMRVCAALGVTLSIAPEQTLPTLDDLLRQQTQRSSAC